MIMPAILILAVLILFPLIFVIVQYNSLVALRNHIRDAWANIDTELNRRYDLIPNLVATVKGYAAHEREVLEKVIELRNRCASGGQAHRQEDEKELVGGLQRLLAVVENYPQLKADQHFLKLQHELVNTEDRIQAARRFYNGNVRDYRNKCEMFPSSLIASAFNFTPVDYFNVDSAVRDQVPSAQF